MSDRDQDEAELQTIETDILPDLRASLNWLMRPDYKPEENPDHEHREQDIDYLLDEIERNQKRARYLRQKSRR